MATLLHLPKVTWWGISVSATLHGTTFLVFAGLAGLQWRSAEIAPPRDGSHLVIALPQSTPVREAVESNLPFTTPAADNTTPVDLTPQPWNKQPPVERFHTPSPLSANSPHRPAVIAKHGSLPTSSRTRTVDEPDPEQAPAKQLDRTLPRAAREQTFLEEVATVEHAQSPSTTSEAAGVKTKALPRSIFSPHPVYPAEALSKGETGRVVLRVQVDATGRVTAVSIDRSSGSQSLDAAASAAIHRWRFNPATGNGTPIACEVRIPVRFRIEP
ncbi:MAG: TonB family protein [Planctomycetota bacterium]|nr:TonB family protein [Planctomycetota bacterium]